MNPCHKLIGDVMVIVIYLFVAWLVGMPAPSMVVGLTTVYLCTVLLNYLERKRIHGEIEKAKEVIERCRLST